MKVTCHITKHNFVVMTMLPPLRCAVQETPIVEVTRQITKHNFLVMNVDDIPRVMKEAFYLARTGRPGEG